MFSISQIANAYHFKSTRIFKRHVRSSGLDKALPKLVGYSATIYQQELSIIQNHLGYSKKIASWIEKVQA